MPRPDRSPISIYAEMTKLNLNGVAGEKKEDKPYVLLSAPLVVQTEQGPVTIGLAEAALDLAATEILAQGLFNCVADTRAEAEKRDKTIDCLEKMKDEIEAATNV